MRTNKRVGALLRKGDEVLLIHRFRDGMEYWVLPGGGVEDEETWEEALIREVMEETTLAIDSFELLGKHPSDTGGEHAFFSVISKEGEPRLGGPEKENTNDNNIYILEWVHKDTARAIENLFPAEIREYF